MDRPSTIPLDPKNPSLIPVQCRCGRALRAKPEQVGSEIRCWDCHQLVIVSVPRERQEVGRELSEGFHDATRWRSFRSILIVAALLTAALCVPRFGVLAGGVALALGAALYGEVIRRVSRVERDAIRPGWVSVLLPRSVVKPVLCALMAAGTVVPLWGLNYGPGVSPHWGRLGAMVAGLTWVLLPLAMLAAHGCDFQGRLGLRKSFVLLARHPFAFVLALAIIPSALTLVELGLGLVLYLGGLLPFFALDFMPIPGHPVFFHGIPYFQMVDFRNYPPDTFLGGYFGGVRRGYSLSAAVPASLSLPTRAGLSANCIDVSEATYYGLRVVLTLVVAIGLVTGFAIQAIWLGAIASLDKKRPAPVPRPAVS